MIGIQICGKTPEREFKILAAEQCTTTDGLVTKAVALLFDNYKKPVPVALKKKLSALGLGLLGPIMWVVTLPC
jgi:hypothetical protein